MIARNAPLNAAEMSRREIIWQTRAVEPNPT